MRQKYNCIGGGLEQNSVMLGWMVVIDARFLLENNREEFKRINASCCSVSLAYTGQAVGVESTVQYAHATFF